MPTLQQLPRDKPVVANPSAAERIQPLGFRNVQVIDHGETATVAGEEGPGLAALLSISWTPSCCLPEHNELLACVNLHLPLPCIHVIQDLKFMGLLTPSFNACKEVPTSVTAWSCCCPHRSVTAWSCCCPHRSVTAWSCCCPHRLVTSWSCYSPYKQADGWTCWRLASLALAI